MVAVAKQALGRDKVVDAPVLNRLGLQVGRTIAATTRVKLRRWSVPRELDSPMTGLRTDGYALLPRLLTPATVSELADVAARVNERDDVAHFTAQLGGNHIDGTWRHDVPDDEREVLDQFWLHPTVTALLSAAERIRLEPGAGRCTIQRLVQCAGEPDREAEIHSDTFHPTHKLWLYLSDVGEDDGPLVYYPGSQALSPRLLRGVYGASISGDRASRAISDKEIAARKLEPKVFTCARGTAVLANTFGYHGRIQGQPPGERLALQVEIRPHPFRRPRSMAVDHSSAVPVEPVASQAEAVEGTIDVVEETVEA
ncbi:MAG: phytanoyl-CoA dioxygenase family protein [Aquihabitans sp.]